MKIDVHVHLHGDDELKEKVDRILHHLEQVQQKETFIMSVLDDLKAGETALFGAVDALVTQSANQNAQIAALQAQIAAGTPASVADLQAIIDSDAAELAKVQAALPPPVVVPPVTSVTS